MGKARRKSFSANEKLKVHAEIRQGTNFLTSKTIIKCFDKLSNTTNSLETCNDDMNNRDTNSFVIETELRNMVDKYYHGQENRNNDNYNLEEYITYNENIEKVGNLIGITVV